MKRFQLTAEQMGKRDGLGGWKLEREENDDDDDEDDDPRVICLSISAH